MFLSKAIARLAVHQSGNTPAHFAAMAFLYLFPIKSKTKLLAAWFPESLENSCPNPRKKSNGW
jgi:hypothetical protein